MLVLSGCGGGSTTSDSSSTAGGVSSTTAGSPAAITGGAGTQSSSQAKSASGAGAVASVEATPVAQATFAHWLAVTAALSGQSGHASSSNTALKDKVMGFLLTSEWVLGEAAALGVDVSEAAVHKRLEEVQKEQFKKPGELQKYLAKNHETMADLLLRVKLELLESAIARKVTAAKHTAAEKKAALASFQDRFQAKWKAKTSCAAGYAMGDCKQ
jgi:hypothetical protein